MTYTSVRLPVHYVCLKLADAAKLLGNIGDRQRSSYLIMCVCGVHFQVGKLEDLIPRAQRARFLELLDRNAVALQVWNKFHSLQPQEDKNNKKDLGYVKSIGSQAEIGGDNRGIGQNELTALMAVPQMIALRQGLQIHSSLPRQPWLDSCTPGELGPQTRDLLQFLHPLRVPDR